MLPRKNNISNPKLINFSMEALPIFLDRISSPVAAILISVTMVLFFGEYKKFSENSYFFLRIIPQSICHKFGLAVGANLAWYKI
jgi:metal transporter CNNM